MRGFPYGPLVLLRDSESSLRSASSLEDRRLLDLANSLPMVPRRIAALNPPFPGTAVSKVDAAIRIGLFSACSASSSAKSFRPTFWYSPLNPLVDRGLEGTIASGDEVSTEVRAKLS